MPPNTPEPPRTREENRVYAIGDQTGLYATPSGLPRSVFVHVAEVCNLRCRYCARQTHGRVGSGLLSYDLFRTYVVPFLDRIDFVQLYGTGEPLLHSQLCDMVRDCKQQGATVMTTSNATLLNRDQAVRLLDAGLDLLVVSLDGCTEEVVARLRGGTRLQDVKDNLKALAQLKAHQQAERPFVELACVLSRTNVHQAAGMIDLAGEMGCGRVKFYNIVIHRPEDRDQDVSHSWRFRWQLWRARRRARRAGVLLDYIFQNPFPEEQVLHPPGCGMRGYCSQLYNGVVVAQDGRVLPCCLSTYSFGTLGEDGDLWEILHSDRAMTFRQQLQSGQFDETCARCGMLQVWTPQLAQKKLQEARQELNGLTPDKRPAANVWLQQLQEEIDVRQRDSGRGSC